MTGTPDRARSTPTVVECVAERGRPTVLLFVGPDGPAGHRAVLVRPVRAYQRATLAVWVIVVVALAALARPVVAELSTPARLLVDAWAVVLAGGGTYLVSALVWRRLIESLVLDGVRTVRPDPEVRAPGGAGGSASDGPDRA